MRENRLEKYRHWPEVTGLASGRARFKPGAQHLDRWRREEGQARMDARRGYGGSGESKVEEGGY